MEKQVNGKLRVKSSTNYVIEVNDNGDTIQLDLADVSLPSKLILLIQDIEKAEKEFQEEVEEIIKREDFEIARGMTQNQLDFYKKQDELCNKCREYIDVVFGKNASEKIFGEYNNPEMFNDFFEAIKPHLDKMGVNLRKMQKGLISKYAPKNHKKVL